MTIDIHAALERLEKNLSQIQSAKEQVQQLTSSNEQVCQIMERYAQAIDSMNVAISSLVQYLDQHTELNIRELKESVEKVQCDSQEYLDQFKQQQADTVESFRKQTQSLLKEYREQNKAMVENTEQLATITQSIKSYNKLSDELKQQLQTLSTNLSSKQKEQEQTLCEIYQCVSDQPSVIERRFHEINQSLLKQNQELKNELNRAIKQTEAKLSQQAEGFQTALGKQQEEFAAQQEANHRAQQLITWISVIGFALLAALHFL